MWSRQVVVSRDRDYDELTQSSPDLLDRLIDQVVLILVSRKGEVSGEEDEIWLTGDRRSRFQVFEEGLLRTWPSKVTRLSSVKIGKMQPRDRHAADTVPHRSICTPSHRLGMGSRRLFRACAAY